jgi:diguanylate cyclase
MDARYAPFVPDVSPLALRSPSTFLDREILWGLGEGHFRLVYQPKYNVRDGIIDSAEALIRWHHPEDGMILPDRFIPHAEDSGTITEITLWTMDQAIADQRAMREEGIDLKIFVNLSARLLTEEPTVVGICERGAQDGVELGVEVTERSVISDPAVAFANIRRLREVGLHISIDDYGAGLSSLTYLKQMEADELKIDKSFIIALGTSHRDPLIVRSTIDLAHALGMIVTAEGVETPAAQALLKVMGCDMMQGYLIGRPVRPEMLGEYLARFDSDRINTPQDMRVFFDNKFWQRA